MAQPNGLEARVAALETKVQELADGMRTSEQDAAAARVLAGGADHDVAQIRGEIRDFRQATTSSFNATREDLADLRTNVDNGFIEVRGKLDAAGAGKQQIVDLLNTAITQLGMSSEVREVAWRMRSISSSAVITGCTATSSSYLRVLHGQFLRRPVAGSCREFSGASPLRLGERERGGG